jgi:hypothetical protein
MPNERLTDDLRARVSPTDMERLHMIAEFWELPQAAVIRMLLRNEAARVTGSGTCFVVESVDAGDRGAT